MKFIFAFLAMAACSAGAITVSDLQCEYLTNPLGIDVTTPRFTWKILDSSDSRGQGQTGYHVLVASRPDLLAAGKADVWDSGAVSSSQSALVPFGGEKLVSGEDCYWKVGVRVKNQTDFVWSAPARFSMGLLNSNDWEGSWIRHPSAPPEKHIWFRKKFLLPDRPASAFAYVASAGYHELYINGHKADDRLLAPSLTRLDKRVLYVTYDVSKLLHAGTNTIGIWYGPGWSRYTTFSGHVPQTFRLQLNAMTASGEKISVPSDDSWRCQISESENIGRYQYMDMGGEKVDARRSCPDWNLPSLDDSQWLFAQKTSLNVSLSAQMLEPTRVLETLKPEAISPVGSNGVFRVDMGKNFTGWLKFSPRGLSAGDVVTIRISNTGATPEDFAQREVFVSGGNGKDVFQNRFNYFGGRYLTIEGLKGKPRSSDITGYAIGTDLKQTGRFQCSNDLFNKIYETDLWTYRVNTVEGYTSDCPHRERLGYGEVASACSWGIGLPEFEAGAFYTKNVRDWADVQRPDGSSPNTAPQMWGAGGPMWCSAGLNISRAFYDTFGDRRIFEAIYPAAIRWVEFLNRNTTNGILHSYSTDRMNFLGDWATPEAKKEYGDTPEALFFNNCVYAMDLDTVVKMATVLGKHDDAVL